MNKDGWGLTTEQAQAISDIIAGYSGLEISSQGLKEAAMMFRGAAEVCELAATLHEKEGREVLLKTACQRLYLPTAKRDAVGAGGAQELAAKMFGPVKVGLVDPITNRRDAWEPKLVACCGIDVVGKKLCAALNRLNSLAPIINTENIEQPEDLTALDGEEPKGDEQPEICSSCNHSVLDMRYPAGL